MERITKRDENGTAFIVLDENSKEWCVSVDQSSYTHTIECEAVDRLAEYEDAEEQGLLLRLPCKVGDTVYAIRQYEKRVKEYKVESFDICGNYSFVRLEYDLGMLSYKIQDFGIWLFTTKEEAEQKLESMKGE